MGDTRSPQLLKINKAIWNYPLCHQITITLEYLPSRLNVRTDWESRNAAYSSESLSENNQTLRNPDSRSVCLQDLSRTFIYDVETRSKQFCNRRRRLAQNVCFCIPTFQLDRSGDTLLLRMSIQRPLLLPALTNLLLNPLGEKHPLLKSRSLRLEAWKIEGISSSATKLISISRKPGSIAGYESAWNKWVSWCC